MNREPLIVRVSTETNSGASRAARLRLCALFAATDPHLRSLPADRYPETRETVRRILAGERVSDYDVELAAGAVEGLRRTGRLQQPAALAETALLPIQ